MEASTAYRIAAGGLVLLFVAVGLSMGMTGSAVAQSGELVDVDAADLAGSGTAADPYEITNASELQAMEDDIDAHYELGNDIDASTTAQWNNKAGFDPIGDGSEDFNGNFDGNQYTISGLTINRGSSAEQVGLFGEVDSALIKSVHLDSAKISGNNSVGALAGYLEADATIQNASMNGSVSGTTETGGLVGSNTDSTVKFASAKGTVTGSDQVGGLVGQNVGGVVTLGSSQATVTATGEEQGGDSARGGGLVGGNFNDGIINKSYATGDVTGGKAGGITGENYDGSRVANTYAAGNVDGRNARSTGGVSGENFESCPFQSEQQCEGFEASTITDSYWDTEATDQSTSAGDAAGLTTSEMTGSAAETNMAAFEFGSIWQTQPDGYQTLIALSSEGDSSEDESNQDSTTGFVDVEVNDLAGSGTSDDPYMITNASELQAMEDDLDAHYKLGNDIDASVTVDSNAGNEFTPIGSVNKSFTGTLNGAGYTITEITIDQQGQSNVGLFGVMNGTVMNIQINAADVTGQGDFPNGVGILAGRIGLTGEVIDAETSGSVIGSEYTGGIAGLAVGNISDSASSATISITDGRGRLGGLVGGLGNTTGSSAYIEGSNASGAVAGGSGRRIGGLVGNQFENTSIRTSYATGPVSGDRYTGGLVGDADGTITDSYSTGRVNWSGKLDNTTNVDINNVALGSLVGAVGSSGRVSDSYARGDVISEGQSDGRGITIAGIAGINFGKIERVAAADVTLRVSNNPAWNDPNGGYYGTRIGGIANNNGNISESYANVTIIAKGTDGLSLGGVTGNNFGSVENTYAVGNITVTESPGNRLNKIAGLTTQNSDGSSFNARGEIRKSYAAVNYDLQTVPADNIAGVVDKNEDGNKEAVVDTVYWDQQRSGVDTGIRESGGSINNVQGLSTDQMTGSSASDAMNGLNFQTVWNTTTGYPELVASPEVTPSSDDSSGSRHQDDDNKSVQITNVSLNQSTIGSESATPHLLTFDALNVSSDGEPDNLTVEMPQSVEIVDVTDVAVVNGDYDVTYSNNESVIEFTVDPERNVDSVDLVFEVDMTLIGSDTAANG